MSEFKKYEPGDIESNGQTESIEPETSAEVEANPIEGMGYFVEGLNRVLGEGFGLWESNGCSEEGLDQRLRAYVERIEETIELLKADPNNTEILSNLLGLKEALQSGPETLASIQKEERKTHTNPFIEQVTSLSTTICQKLGRTIHVIHENEKNNPEAEKAIEWLSGQYDICEKALDKIKELAESYCDTDLGLDKEVEHWDLLPTLKKLIEEEKIEGIDADGVSALLRMMSMRLTTSEKLVAYINRGLMEEDEFKQEEFLHELAQKIEADEKIKEMILNDNYEEEVFRQFFKIAYKMSSERKVPCLNPRDMERLKEILLSKIKEEK